jgi:hypothetical protein
LPLCHSLIIRRCCTRWPLQLWQQPPLARPPRQMQMANPKAAGPISSSARTTGMCRARTTTGSSTVSRSSIPSKSQELPFRVPLSSQADQPARSCDPNGVIQSDIILCTNKCTCKLDSSDVLPCAGPGVPPGWQVQPCKAEEQSAENGEQGIQGDGSTAAE